MSGPRSAPVSGNHPRVVHRNKDGFFEVGSAQPQAETQTQRAVAALPTVGRDKDGYFTPTLTRSGVAFNPSGTNTRVRSGSDSSSNPSNPNNPNNPNNTIGRSPKPLKPLPQKSFSDYPLYSDLSRNRRPSQSNNNTDFFGSLDSAPIVPARKESRDRSRSRGRNDTRTLERQARSDDELPKTLKRSASRGRGLKEQFEFGDTGGRDAVVVNKVVSSSTSTTVKVATLGRVNTVNGNTGSNGSDTRDYDRERLRERYTRPDRTVNTDQISSPPLSATTQAFKDKLRPTSPPVITNPSPTSPKATDIISARLKPSAPLLTTSLSSLSSAKASPLFDDMLSDLNEIERRVSNMPPPKLTARNEEEIKAVTASLESFTSQPSKSTTDAVQRLRTLQRKRSGSRDKKEEIGFEEMKEKVLMKRENIEREKIEKERREREERERKEREDRERRDREDRERIEREDRERRDREEKSRIVKPRSPLPRTPLPKPSQSSPPPDIVKLQPVDESVIDPDSIKALLSCLKQDTSPSPLPSDFTDPDGFQTWQHTIGRSFPSVLRELLYSRYLDPNGRGRPQQQQQAKPNTTVTVVDIFFKIVQGRNFPNKELYCTLITETDKFNTNSDKAAVWNQHLNIPVKNVSEVVTLQVFEGKKMVGKALIAMADIITQCAREGYTSKWISIEKEKKNEVVGEVLIEVNIDDSNNKKNTSASSVDPEAALRKLMVNSRVSFQSIYKVLLNACLTSDMNYAKQKGMVIKETTTELLSIQSKAVLMVFARQWGVNEAFCTIALLDALFEKYRVYEGATTLSQRTVLENLRESMKRHEGWLSDSEKPALLELFDKMRDHYTKQVTRYRDFFPKNQPPHALETTLIMLRMIFKNQVYRDAHPDLPISFRDEIRNFMTIALIARYQSLQELAAPFDNTDVTGVVAGVLKFVEMLAEDISADIQYFDAPFSKDIEISKLTAETYLKYLVLTLETHAEIFVDEHTIKTCAGVVFDVYKRVRDLDEKYSALVPSLKRRSMNQGFSVERWFQPFIARWLNVINDKTMEWVKNAVESDKFDTMERIGEVMCSESIVTVLKAVFEELEFILDLRWSNSVQNAGFLQSFARMVNRGIELYCDAIAIGETKEEMKELTLWSSVTTAATAAAANAANLVTGKDQGPSNIALESCVKLCNVEYALLKLEELYNLMNVATVTQTQKSYREKRRTMAPFRKSTKPKKPQRPPSPTGTTLRGLSETESIRGPMKFEIAYAENIKPCLSNGMANPYLVIKVPDGTVIDSTFIDDSDDDDDEFNYDTAMGIQRDDERIFMELAVSSMQKSKGKPAALILADDKAKRRTVILNGSDCELVKSRAVYATVNPTWDETFEVLLPPVNQLQFTVLSKNMLTSDEIAGKAALDLGSVSRVRRRLADHQTHDVMVELEPQGRVMVRMTLVGEDEDVEFWFRKSKERFGRIRDDFIRALTGRLVTYLRQVILKAVKAEEAAPVPTKGFFTSLTQAVVLSNVTAAGVSINEPVRPNEIATAAEPLYEYLDRNLGTLCESLSTDMAHQVIKRIWDELISVILIVVIPPLYGEIERDRRVLTKRQVSLVEGILESMQNFFHADGEGLGLPMQTLENRRVKDLKGVLKGYSGELNKLKSEYESSVRTGREKEYVLRVVRLRVEKEEGMGDVERADSREWVEKMIMRRQERR